MLVHRPTALAALTALLATALPAQESKLPIREITLYRSGVGAFEHVGRLRGDVRAQLKFPTDAVNDILKSMTILDLGGGSIGPVSYGSKEPLERRLASFGVDISKAPSIPDLFRQLRGARLKVVTLDGTREGTILGVEDRQVVAAAGDDAAVVVRPHLNLLTDGGVRSVEVASIASFELLDEALAEELRLALAALADQRAERIKTVDLSFRGDAAKERTVVVTYVREMPVWKTSYRLVLPEDTNDGANDGTKEAAKPTLQGWAIVENTTDDEWNDVRLSLASGRPVGFTMDLYQPIYAARPDVPVPLDEGLAPKLYDSSGRPMPEPPAARRAALAREMGELTDRAIVGAVENKRMKSVESELRALGYVQADGLGESQASGGEVGGQFHYTVDAPVTLARQRSAMLPILLSKIDGRRLSILTVENPLRAPEHPMQGVELTNDTDLHLMPGPIAVFDGGAYAGDAQIDHTARNQRRLLSFAMDIDVECKTRATSEETLVGVKIVDGAIVQATRQENRRTYELVNYDEQRGRTVLVEYPKSGGWSLKVPAEPTEETSSAYRFEVSLPAGGQAVREVVEVRTLEHRMAVTSYPLPTILEFRSDGKASQAVVDAIARAADLQARVHAKAEELNRLDAERRAIAEEQGRIRDNLGRVPANSDLHRRYVEKLGAQEDRLDAITAERVSVEDARDEAQRALNEFLRDLDVE